MPAKIRSDDYIDGLQVAYKVVSQISQGSHGQSAMAFSLALQAIDKAIAEAISEEAPRIILAR